MKKAHNIITIGGDGIGPEVINEAIRLLKETPIRFNFISAEAGYGSYLKYNTPLPKKTLNFCKNADVILFGAVTTPPNIENYKSPIILLRRNLNLFANVRPFYSLPISSSRKNINFIIVRENTEDLYVGQERLTKEGAIAERVITKKASKRIIDFAFQFAIQKKRKKVTVVHKANVLRLTDGLFLAIARQVAKKYPQIQLEEIIVDACAMKLIKNPEDFEILVTTNMFGDILSDESAALVGGLGIASSANIGLKIALFEPIHGSAPKYQGKNIANPLATFFATCMMLEYLGEIKISKKIKYAITSVLTKKILTKDLGGTATMTEFTDAVIHSYISL